MRSSHTNKTKPLRGGVENVRVKRVVPHRQIGVVVPQYTNALGRELGVGGDRPQPDGEVDRGAPVALLVDRRPRLEEGPDALDPPSVDCHVEGGVLVVVSLVEVVGAAELGCPAAGGGLSSLRLPTDGAGACFPRSALDRKSVV